MVRCWLERGADGGVWLVGLAGMAGRPRVRARVTGGVLVYCHRKRDGRALARPLGWGWFKCNYCGATFRGVEE